MGLTRSSRKIDGLKLSGLLIGASHQRLNMRVSDPIRRIHAASTPPPRRCHQTTRRISRDGSLVVVAPPRRPARRRERPRREASLLNPPLMTDVEN